MPALEVAVQVARFAHDNIVVVAIVGIVRRALEVVVGVLLHVFGRHVCRGSRVQVHRTWLAEHAATDGGCRLLTVRGRGRAESESVR